MLDAFLSFFSGGLLDVLEWLIGMFPGMPFTTDDVVSAMGDTGEIVSYGLGWANYFLSLDVILGFVTAWVGSIVTFIAVRAIYRFVKSIFGMV